MQTIGRLGSLSALISPPFVLVFADETRPPRPTCKIDTFQATQHKRKTESDRVLRDHHLTKTNLTQISYAQLTSGIVRRSIRH